MARLGRCRRKRLDTLIDRYNWLKGKRRALKVQGKETWMIRREMEALEWALPLMHQDLNAAMDGAKEENE